MSIKKNFFAPLASGLGATRRAAMLLLVMMLTTVTTWADNVTLTSSTTSWKNNTYETNGDVTIEGRITVTGNVKLILTDGYTLSAPNGIEVKVGNSLTIEGGTNGTGTLIIAKNEYSKAGIGGGSGTHSWDPIKYGNITINGGIVNVKGGAQSAGIGGGCNSELTGNGTITINGGIVNATGGNKAAGIGGGNCSLNNGAKGGCGDIVINGGQVTATGGDDAPGIGPGNGAADKTSGSLKLGWTNTSDFIQVTGGNSIKNTYGFSNRLESISFAKDKKFNISGGKEATTDNIKNQKSLTLIPKGSEQHQLSVATISGISASYDLTGSYLDIPFSVIDAEENTLTLGTDYTATLGTTSQESTTIHITEGGKYTLTVTGMGSYAGSKSVDFEVISIGFKKDANGDDYINMPKTGIYDANIPEGVSSFKVYDDGGAKAKYSNSYDGGLVLTAPDHYVLQLTGTVTAEVQVNNPLDYLMVYDGGSTSAQKIGDKYGSDESGENIGTLISSGTQMTLTFHSDNSGQRDGLDLKVTLKRDLGSCVIANIDDQPYTGSAIEPDLVITYEGTALVKDVDYEVAYSANTILGTATITITGKENYAGTTSKTFNIVKATPTVTAPAAVENLIYTGGSLNLVAAGTTDFGTLLYSTDDNNYSKDIPTATDAGTYTVYYKVAGDANHNDVSGSIEVTITQKAVTNDGITFTIPSQPWTGSELTPVITVKDGETVLAENTDYTVTAPSGTIQDAGDYTYTITGMGNYSGEKAATFTIVNPVNTSYVDATGTLHENVQAIPLDNTMTTLPTGTYVVNSDVAYTGTVTLSGDVKLILGDGCTMSFGTENANLDATIIECNNHNLTIYGQSGGTGWLKAYSAQNDGINAVYDYKQYSGNVLIRHYSAYCIDADNSVTLLGGTLDVKSEGGANGDIVGGSISILGGKLWARNKGLKTMSDKIILGYTNATDEIYAYSYQPQNGLEIADGKTLVDENGTIWSGTLEVVHQIGFNNSTLKPVMGVTLTKDGNNVSATFDGTSTTTMSIPVDVNVTSVTYNRAFTMDKPSTVMLPFSLGEGQTLTGGTLYKFTGVTKNETAGKWEATMTETATLQANTPYLLMPDDELTDGKVTFDLNNGTVTLNTNGGGNRVTADEGSHWTFKGTYEYMKWTDDSNDPDYNADREAEIGRAYGFAGVAKDNIDVGDFVKVASGAKIRPMCCYLLWNDTPNSANARSFTRGAAATDEELPQSITVRLVGSNGETTAIGTLDTKTGEIDFSGWYDMSGHKLSGKPTKKGLYINNGKKVVIK